MNKIVHICALSLCFLSAFGMNEPALKKQKPDTQVQTSFMQLPPEIQLPILIASLSKNYPVQDSIKRLLELRAIHPKLAHTMTKSWLLHGRTIKNLAKQLGVSERIVALIVCVYLPINGKSIPEFILLTKRLITCSLRMQLIKHAINS